MLFKVINWAISYFSTVMGAIPKAVAGWLVGVRVRPDRPQAAGSWLGLAIRIVILTTTMTMTLLLNESSSFTLSES